jgi:hypothetical protein
MPIGCRRRRGKRPPDLVAEGGLLCRPFAFGGGHCCCSSTYTHTAKLSMMARTNIRSSSMMLWPPGVGGHVCTLRKAWSDQVGINSAATPAPPSIPTAKTNTAVMALTSRRRLCLLDMASSLIVIPSADCPIHNVPIVTLCMKQITFRTMISLMKTRKRILGLQRGVEGIS